MNDPELFKTLGQAHAQDLLDAVELLKAADAFDSSFRFNVAFNLGIDPDPLIARLNARANAILQKQPS